MPASWNSRARLVEPGWSAMCRREKKVERVERNVTTEGLNTPSIMTYPTKKCAHWIPFKERRVLNKDAVRWRCSLLRTRFRKKWGAIPNRREGRIQDLYIFVATGRLYRASPGVSLEERASVHSCSGEWYRRRWWWNGTGTPKIRQIFYKDRCWPNNYLYKGKGGSIKKLLILFIRTVFPPS